LRSLDRIDITQYYWMMGQIVIRNLDDAVLDALRRRARDRSSSLEEEARQALAASVGLTRAEALRRIDEIRAEIGRLPGESTLEILRRDRRRDELDEEL
jgi:plasmid stability protein